MRTRVAHGGVQQVHGGSAQPQAVDGVGRLLEVGHHATGAHCGAAQLGPLARRSAPGMLQLGGTRGPEATRYGRRHGKGGKKKKKTVTNFAPEGCPGCIVTFLQADYWHILGSEVVLTGVNSYKVGISKTCRNMTEIKSNLSSPGNLVLENWSGNSSQNVQNELNI